MDLDEAALRRLTKRIYIPLPDKKSRKNYIETLFDQVQLNLDAAEIKEIVRMTDNYSFADIKALIKDSAMAPVRDKDVLNPTTIKKLKK